MQIKEYDDNGRPKLVEIECGPRYGNITNYESNHIFWTTDRLGYFHEYVCTWNQKSGEFKTHWFGMDMHKATKILDILVELGVVP